MWPVRDIAVIKLVIQSLYSEVEAEHETVTQSECIFLINDQI